MGKVRPIDWAPIYASIRRHRQTRRLGRMLKISRPWHLVIDLILEACDEYPTGELVGLEAEDIADICGWDGDPARLILALVDSDYLIEELEGGAAKYTIANWRTYGGKVIDQREQAAERKRRQRARAQAKSNDPDSDGTVSHEGVTRDNDRTNVTVTGCAGRVESRENERSTLLDRGADATRHDYNPDRLTLEDIEGRLISEFGFGRGNVGSTWSPVISGIQPITEEDLAKAIGTAKEHAAERGQRVGAGYVIRILERRHNEKAASPATLSSGGKRRRSGWVTATQKLLEEGPPRE